jgi:hypothetical protein
VTLSVLGGNDGAALGQLYWDDGDSIIDNFVTYNYFQWTFNYTQTSTSAQVTMQRMKTATVCVSIKIDNYYHVTGHCYTDTGYY